ncbi:alpha/beta family hydrolase [Virgisporangium ochraceum]|uniref:Putative phosphoribosyl transferase n=1 Tax=Virgisporangium ochraceum TaxID=65505 RepID=A0A8J4EEG1_9ACTN|nr:alpha/beta family hydrolase [Virgisporangium ochraceum]GIJ71696.1 putative phosphoribosyl transferase [Virgisporangium ochraceum]
MRFVNRSEAGRRLARRLSHLRGRDVVVLGLPCGGVPVAFEVAEVLEAPLDVALVRKIGVPFQPELALGAVGEDGVYVFNPAVIHDAGVRTGELDALDRAARANLTRRAERLRNGRPRLKLAGRTAVIVDDGVATGATMRAACRIAWAQGAAAVIAATPVAAPTSLEALRRVADEVVCLASPPSFTAVGEWYVDFTPVSDETVGGLLARASGEHAAPLPAVHPPGTDVDVTVDAASARLAGHLCVPPGAGGLVVFAHGSGSSRHSPRNRYVAGRLSDAGLATLLFDLLTPAEEGDRGRVFGIGLLAHRLAAVVDHIRHRPDLAGLPVGLFGASTGAAAALRAAADPRCGQVAAVVCRGGRPDLGGEHLRAVAAPTLLIVGGADTAVLDLNRAAQARLTCPNRLVVVPGATHLFEEPRALETVADLAVTWFWRYLVQPARSPESVAA